MATKQIDELINSTLTDKQIDLMFELQTGRPEFLVDEKSVAVLDELDLVNRIKYTSVRSNEAVLGWALSERGNQVVEEVRRRHDREDVIRHNEKAAQAKANPKVTTPTKDTKDNGKS